MDGQKWPKDRGQELLSVVTAHASRETSRRDIEKLLYYLVADDAFPGFKRLTNQLPGSFRLWRRPVIEGIHDYVGIEEESIAHSFRHG